MRNEYRNDELIALGAVSVDTRGKDDGVEDQDNGLDFGFGLPILLDD